jgi:hypothetical protein
MTSQTPISVLQEEERRARRRLAAFRAKLYEPGDGGAMRAKLRLHELERKWEGAAERLRKARRSAS